MNTYKPGDHYPGWKDLIPLPEGTMKSLGLRRDTIFVQVVKDNTEFPVGTVLQIDPEDEDETQEVMYLRDGKNTEGVYLSHLSPLPKVEELTTTHITGEPTTLDIESLKKALREIQWNPNITTRLGRVGIDYGINTSYISKPLKFMNGLKKLYRKATLSKEDRLLLNAGITDEEGDLTGEGKELLLSTLLDLNKAVMVEQAQKIVDEKEKE